MIGRTITRAFAGLVLLLGATAALAADYYVDVTNRTGYTMVYLYVSPASSSSWEEDVLGNDVLLSGESQRVTLHGYNSPVFDIRLVDEDGDTYTYYGVDVSRFDITVTLDDLDEAQQASSDYYVDVTNGTGYTMLYLQVSHASNPNWGGDLLGDDVLSPGQTSRVTLWNAPNPIFDIRLTDEDGDTYTFFGIDVAREDLLVTLDDID